MANFCATFSSINQAFAVVQKYLAGNALSCCTKMTILRTGSHIFGSGNATRASTLQTEMTRTLWWKCAVKPGMNGWETKR